MDNEVGGHRIQRIPPTESKGRVHTSTVTVAVLDNQTTVVSFNESDFTVEWFSGTGKGGQHRNKHQNSCRLCHNPSGLVETRQGRHRESNLKEARSALESKLVDQFRATNQSNISAIKKKQVGSGMRGDKIITLRFQDDRAQHHTTGKAMKASKYMKGFMDDLWI